MSFPPDKAAELDFIPKIGRRVPVVLQAEAAECGLACLAMIAGYYGSKERIADLRQRLPLTMRGVTLAKLIRMASTLNLTSRAVRVEPQTLRQIQLPAILHWEMDHFVVLERIKRGRFTVIDPARGRTTYSRDELSKRFTGVALELKAAVGFEPRKATSRLTLSSFFRGVTGLWPAIGKIFVMSMALNGFAVMAPLFTQIVIDTIVVSQNYQLLALLALAFGGLAVFGAIIQALRSFTVLYFGSSIQVGWSARLFHHLVRLPLSYFERRHLGDVLSRYRSLGALQSVLTTTLVETVIDGLMTIITVSLMFAYSPKLTMLSLAALACYAGIRAGFYRLQRDASNEALVQSAREDSHFLESLRGIMAIKVFAREEVRASQWQNRVVDSVRSSQVSQAYGNWQQLCRQVLFAVENILIIWLGAIEVIQGSFTIGMLVAFLSYKAMLSGRASALIDKVLEITLLSVPLERLSDILLSEKETALKGSTGCGGKLIGSVEARAISYSYAPDEPDTLSNVSLLVEPGSCVAVHAPSGSGKTTFLKILMGLLEPTKGEILVDGMPLKKFGTTNFRGQISAVMQDDSLLSGSLLDNIVFFQAVPDHDFAVECARKACIYEDIERMPMGMSTLVGDMGAALSGGQRQRLLLARALYAKPAILFLDEATSHVDVATERKIHETLSSLNITRILISHRKETLEIADQVVDLNSIKSIGLQTN